MEQRNREKSKLLYDVLDDSELYKAVADPENRSICNVTFRLDDDEMEKIPQTVPERRTLCP